MKLKPSISLSLSSLMIFATACYSPSFDGEGGFECAKEGTCPEGFTCNTVTDRCEKGGEPSGDLGPLSEGPTPTGQWVCEGTEKPLIEVRNVVSETFGFYFADNKLYVSFTGKDGNTRPEEARMGQIDVGSSTVGVTTFQQAVGNRHTTVAPPVRDWPASYVFNARAALSAWSFQFHDSKGGMSREMLISEQDEVGLSPVLWPLPDADIDERLYLVSHVRGLGSDSGELETFVYAPDVEAQEPVEPPIVPGYPQVFPLLRGAVGRVEGAAALTFVAKAAPGYSSEQQVAFATIVAEPDGARWETNVVDGSNAAPPAQYAGVGAAYQESTLWLAYAQGTDDSTSAILLSKNGAPGDRITPEGWGVAPLGRPALALAGPNTKAGLAAVSQNRVYFTFSDAITPGEARWTKPLELKEASMNNAARIELVALPQATDDEPRARFFVAFPTSDERLVGYDITCEQFLGI